MNSRGYVQLPDSWNVNRDNASEIYYCILRVDRVVAFRFIFPNNVIISSVKEMLLAI